MANNVNDPQWLALIPDDVRGRIAGAPSISDGDDQTVWVVFANLIGPEFFSGVYDPKTKGWAYTISPSRAIAEADLRRRRVHGRVGIV